MILSGAGDHGGGWSGGAGLTVIALACGLASWATTGVPTVLVGAGSDVIGNKKDPPRMREVCASAGWS